MPKFLAVTSRGLEDVLMREAKELEIPRLAAASTGVSFEGGWQYCYRMNLRSRFSTRILMPILDFIAYKQEEIYNQIQKHDYTKYIPAHGSLRVDAKTEECAMKDQRMLAMIVKDAIVDQFRDKYGERPDVDKENPDLRIHIKGYKNSYQVAIDTSGVALSKRGYRRSQVIAPLRETVAAGVIALTGWDGKSVIVDPMCGSGTFLIEAALMAQKIYPGTLKGKFSFQKFSTFDEDVWQKELDSCLNEEAAEVEEYEGEKMFFGFDKDRDALKAAITNAKAAGVDHLIDFRRGDVRDLEWGESKPKGIIITNPPYGVRLGEEAFLVELYRDFAYVLKKEFKGWEAWILSGNRELTQHLGMKANRRIPVMNGNLDCRLLHYRINKS